MSGFMAWVASGAEQRHPTTALPVHRGSSSNAGADARRRRRTSRGCRRPFTHRCVLLAARLARRDLPGARRSNRRG